VTAPRVLVVDDSAFARTALTRMLRASGRVEVVGSAADGAEALEDIARLDPDVVTLDLTMPRVDGLGVLRALAGRSRPRVIVVSISSVETSRGVEALALGALHIVAKPTALASDRLFELADELIATILALEPPAPAAADGPPTPSPVGVPGRRAELVMIGTSTGGPQALTRVLAALPADLAAPVAMVVHIPAGYTAALAQRLDKGSPLRVVEASPGLALRPGIAVLARAGRHLKIERRDGALLAQLEALPARAHTPAVDELFLSGAAAAGAGCLGVVLTGMGDDGLEGARAIVQAGGMVLTEAASTCVVYGMPRSVHEAGLGAAVAALDRIAEEIIRRV
jgi:two-component system, chemotaxis family, protein-glutamate methylesterase/glutaminase